ncbi:hypothetical protein A2U01_0064113, partial [Trifolium medium]|nr:hypothetical protein [Trifolium medium]
SFGVPPGYSSSLKPSTGLPHYLGFAAPVLTEHISAILLFIVPPDLPLGFDGPPVMDTVVRLFVFDLMSPSVIAATNGLLPGFLSSSLMSASLSSITSTLFLGGDSLLGDHFLL